MQAFREMKKKNLLFNDLNLINKNLFVERKL